MVAAELGAVGVGLAGALVVAADALARGAGVGLGAWVAVAAAGAVVGLADAARLRITGLDGAGAAIVADQRRAGTHLPPLHWSPLVQASPSSQAEASSCLTWQPLAVSHVSAVQLFLSSQLTAALLQMPLFTSQASVVQALESSQSLSALHGGTQPEIGTCWHLPVFWSQASAVQGLLSLQTVGVPPLHRPPWQASPDVQPEPSSQGLVVPDQLQPLALQTSAVQELPSSHWVESPLATQPSLPSQLSTVQSTPSLQTTGA